MKKVRVIAEMCCNHCGNIELAKKMIYEAKVNCNVDIVKFQKRNIDIWAKKKPDVYNSEHPNPSNSFGKTYREHREFLELSFEQHKELKQYCDELGVDYSASVWDIPSAEEITSLNPKLIKIASACNNYFELLEWICKNFKGEIHLSLGMTTREEIDEIVNYFIKNNRNKDLVLYCCTSGYPVKPEEVCLLEITRLKNEYGDKVKEIGFSGHHFGTILDIGACSLGATVIERHFSMDKKMKGTDQIASLETKEMAKLVDDIDEITKALRFKEQEILDIEKNNKEKLKW